MNPARIDPIPRLHFSAGVWFWLLAALPLPSLAGTITLSPVADTYVQGADKKTTNFGTTNRLVMKTKAKQPRVTRKIILRYDLSQVPAKAKITGAKLVFTLVTTLKSEAGWDAITLRVKGVKDATPHEQFNETQVTWDNLPWHNKQGGGFSNTLTTGLGSNTLNLKDKKSGQNFTFSDAGLLQFVKQDRNGIVTLGVDIGDGKAEGILNVASKEHPNHPSIQLVLTTDASSQALTDRFHFVTGSTRIGPVRMAKNSAFTIAGTKFHISRTGRVGQALHYYVASDRTQKEYGPFVYGTGRKAKIGGVVFRITP